MSSNDPKPIINIEIEELINYISSKKYHILTTSILAFAISIILQSSPKKMTEAKAIIAVENNRYSKDYLYLTVQSKEFLDHIKKLKSNTSLFSTQLSKDIVFSNIGNLLQVSIQSSSNTNLSGFLTTVINSLNSFFLMKLSKYKDNILINFNEELNKLPNQEEKAALNLYKYEVMSAYIAAKTKGGYLTFIDDPKEETSVLSRKRMAIKTLTSILFVAISHVFFLSFFYILKKTPSINS